METNKQWVMNMSEMQKVAFAVGVVTLLFIFILWFIGSMVAIAQWCRRRRSLSYPTLVDTDLLESVDAKAAQLLPLLEGRDDLAERLTVLQNKFEMMSKDLKDVEESVSTLEKDHKAMEGLLFDLDRVVNADDWDDDPDDSDIDDEYDWPDDDEWDEDFDDYDDESDSYFDEDDSETEWEPDCGSPTETETTVHQPIVVEQFSSPEHYGILSHPDAATILAGASMVVDDLSSLSMSQSVTLPADQWDVRQTAEGYEVSRKSGGDLSG